MWAMMLLALAASHSDDGSPILVPLIHARGAVHAMNRTELVRELQERGAVHGAAESDDRLRLRLAEANPLTGALKFELEQGGSAPIEPRGKPLPMKKRGQHLVGQRGRPANIRHQGRRKK